MATPKKLPYAGGFDTPPILLKASPVKAVLLVLGSGLLAVAGTSMLGDAASRAKGEACIVFFGLCALVGLARLIQPDRLELSPGGVRYRGFLGRGWHASWPDISDVSVYRSRSAMVTFKLAGPQGVRGGALPSGWPMSADDLAALLTEAKAHWS